MSRIYLFNRYERTRHWILAALIPVLAATGFEVHGSLRLIGFSRAVIVHELAAASLILLTAFSFLRSASNAESRHFARGRRGLAERVRFFTGGVFRRAPHPEITTPDEKLGPVARAAYFVLLIVVFPLHVTAGFVYLGTPFWPSLIDTMGGLPILALVHTTGAIAMLTFVVVHLYTILDGPARGPKPTSMVTGWVER